MALCVLSPPSVVLLTGSLPAWLWAGAGLGMQQASQWYVPDRGFDKQRSLAFSVAYKQLKAQNSSDTVRLQVISRGWGSLVENV